LVAAASPRDQSSESHNETGQARANDRSRNGGSFESRVCAIDANRKVVNVAVETIARAVAKPTPKRTPPNPSLTFTIVALAFARMSVLSETAPSPGVPVPLSS
jgi:hypothetical protein